MAMRVISYSGNIHRGAFLFPAPAPISIHCQNKKGAFFTPKNFSLVPSLNWKKRRSRIIQCCSRVHRVEEEAIEELEEFLVVSFYKFVFIEDPEAEVSKHQAFLEERDIHGRIYVNEQGINAQYSGPRKDVLAYAQWLKDDHKFTDILVQTSPSLNGHAFPRLKLRYKPSLVQFEGGTLHLPLLDPSMRATPLPPSEWRKRLEVANKVDMQSEKENLVHNRKFLLLDVRNGYEWDIGHFKGANRPNVDCFRGTSFGLSDQEAVMASRGPRTPRGRPGTPPSAGVTPPFVGECIVISDDESEGAFSSSDQQPSLQSQPKPEFPTPPDTGREGRPQVDFDGPLPQIQPIAEIVQGSVVPDSSSVRGLLQRLENALKQAISIIEVRWGTFMDFRPFLFDSLEEIRHAGGAQLADRCEDKLIDWLILAYSVDSLVYSDSCNEVSRLIGEARAKASRERVARERRISLQEGVFVDSHARQCHLQSEIDAYHAHVSRTGVKTAQGEKTLRIFTKECTRVQGVTEHAKQVLEAMRREHAAALAANSEEELEKEAKAQAQRKREERLATVKADLASFTVLDCADPV